MRSAPQSVIANIEHCLRPGCVVCIEHAAAMSPRFTTWQVWAQPCCFNGDKERLYTEIDRCRDQYADHHIRLNIEDHGFRSRFSVIVHGPVTGVH